MILKMTLENIMEKTGNLSLRKDLTQTPIVVLSHGWRTLSKAHVISVFLLEIH